MLYVTILIVLEVLIFIFTLVGKQQDTLMMNLMRILLLVGAHCLKSISWAAYYALFAFITALYIFDPVGLWITGRTSPPNQMARPRIKFRMPSAWSPSSAQSSLHTSAISTRKPLRGRRRRISLGSSGGAVPSISRQATCMD